MRRLGNNMKVNKVKRAYTHTHSEVITAEKDRYLIK